MSREVRRVPIGWVHPGTKVRRFAVETDGYQPESDEKPVRVHDGTWLVTDFQPMFDKPWAEAVVVERKERVEHPEWYEENDDGHLPNPLYYRPAWPDDEPLGYQLYETVSEGTPISPVFATPDELADWMTQGFNGLGIGGRNVAMTVEQALAWLRRGRSISMVGGPGGIVSGVEFDIAHPHD